MIRLFSHMAVLNRQNSHIHNVTFHLERVFSAINWTKNVIHKLEATCNVISQN
jgi:hypothetical protein